jgi:2-oxoglutarate dehydrogenase E2 component (dihydrolipoamide succinyltransferase)
MKIIEMLMPPMGESIMECTVLHLLKQVGDVISSDDSVLEVATDKVDTEVPSPYSGKIIEWLVKVDDVVPIGNPVAKIEVDDQVPYIDIVAIDSQVSPDVVDAAAELEQALETGMARTNLSTHIAQPDANLFYSPLVKRIADQEKISQQELASIPGTGAENRVTKEDLLTYIKNRSKTIVTPPITRSLEGATEIIEMDRMRKMISQRMVDSKRISPHVTSFIETDMTRVVNWREKIKNEFKARTGDGITFTPILIEAVVKAIQQYPMINISVEGDKMIKKRDINIGMAVALPDGNLIVPVIHRANEYTLPQLAHKVNDLARRARENKLKADDLSGGTYTISNIGAFGNLMGTPIIVQPQVAIMAFGAIKKKPAVIETPDGDLIGIRNLMFISHSYDHRVVDGSLGGMFLKAVHDHLEKFDTDRLTV